MAKFSRGMKVKVVADAYSPHLVGQTGTVVKHEHGIYHVRLDLSKKMREFLDDELQSEGAAEDRTDAKSPPDDGAKVKALRTKWVKGRDDDGGDAADQVVRVMLRRYPRHQVDAFTDNVATRTSNPNQHYQALLDSGENVIHQHFDRWLKEAD